MGSSDPWFDWYIDFGSLDGFPNVPPEFASLTSYAGTDVTGWRDSDGNIRPSFDPFPSLPPNAPQCAKEFYDTVIQGLGNAWIYARSYCTTCQLRLTFNPTFTPIRPPIQYIGFVIACGDSNGANWGDPCASGGFAVPQDCDFFEDFFGGYFLKNCPQRELTQAFSPAVHRLVSEIVSPTGRSFLWRLAYDQPVFWPLVLNPEVLLEENTCKSFALAIELQIEALQDLINQASGETVFIRFSRYFDGILEGRKYEIFESNGSFLGYGLIGYSRILELAACLETGIFREDIGRVACEREEEEMGCDCEEIRQIVREEIEAVKVEFLQPVKENTDWLSNFIRGLESSISEFFGGSSENSWSTYLSRFSILSGFLRPADTDPDTVITPPLPDRIAESFSKSRERQAILFDWIRGTIKVRVRFSITGEKISSRDTVIPPESKRPYNHYGQAWVVYSFGGQPERRTTWQWIRSRDAELEFTVPDQRRNPADAVSIRADYQLFSALYCNPPEVSFILPKLGTPELWSS